MKHSHQYFLVGELQLVAHPLSQHVSSISTYKITVRYLILFLNNLGTKNLRKASLKVTNCTRKGSKVCAESPSLLGREGVCSGNF